MKFGRRWLARYTESRQCKHEVLRWKEFYCTLCLFCSSSFSFRKVVYPSSMDRRRTWISAKSKNESLLYYEKQKVMVSFTVQTYIFGTYTIIHKLYSPFVFPGNNLCCQCIHHCCSITTYHFKKLNMSISSYTDLHCCKRLFSATKWKQSIPGSLVTNMRAFSARFSIRWAPLPAL